MKFRFFTLLLAFASFGTALFGQSKVVISIPDVVATGDAPICVPVSADSFPNIVVTQFSINWDTSEVAFQEIQLGDNPLGFDAMATSNPRPGHFRVGFIPSDAQGIELAPGTVIFEICFTPKNASGFTALNFYSPDFLPEFTQEPSFDPFAFDTIPGSISYGGTVATTVLPGDTDDNAQVDHRDLLNLGLLHGETGPARINPSTEFVTQIATRWPGNLNSGVNYAQVDANGDGVIDDNDLSLVEAYYSQEADGNFEFAPTVSSPAGPVLGLSFDGMIDAGQEASMTVSLGDGSNANAVGYGLAFTLLFDPSQVDMSTVAVDFSNSFLGNDLLTLAEVNPRANGILEVALSRKDQINTTTPGGEVMKVTFTTIPAANNDNYNLVVSSFPNAFLRADQSSAPINGGSGEVEVMGSSAINTPAWAAEATVFPNPTTDRVHIQGLTITAPLVYTVYNRWGQMIKQEPYTGQDISLEGLPVGMYVLVLSDGIQRWTSNISVSK